MGTIKIPPDMHRHLEELRNTRRQYEAASGTKVIGTGGRKMTQEEADMVELVNAVKAAKQLYESLTMESEIMKELRAQWKKSGSM